MWNVKSLFLIAGVAMDKPCSVQINTILENLWA